MKKDVKIAVFEPQSEGKCMYAMVLGSTGGPIILSTYWHLREFADAYEGAVEFTKQHHLHCPVPVRFVDKKGITSTLEESGGRCLQIRELINREDPRRN